MIDLSDKDATLGDIATYQAGVMQSSAHRVLKKFTNACLKEHGITTMQWFMIGTIYDTGEAGIRINQLSSVMNTNLPYITNALNLLESKGVVERIKSPGDSRGKRVRITEDFRPRCTLIEADLRQKMRTGIYSRIDPDQLRTYLLVLQQLNKLDGPGDT